VSYNAAQHTLSTNDDGALNQGYLGYPAIAFLLKTGKLKYDERLLSLLKGIDWTKIKRQANKHHEETLRILLGQIFSAGGDVDALSAECEDILEQIRELKLEKDT
jgi:hypothetical protein